MSSLDRERWQAISPYLDRAIEMEPDELAAWLTSLRAEQPALAADLEMLLDDRNALGQERFLEAGGLVPPPPPMGQESAASSGPGRREGATALGPDSAEDGALSEAMQTSRDRTLGTIGVYRLLRLLGEGGMGIVYLAEQTEPIRREVALKVIKPGLDSARVLARFAVERQILANLNHPGISKVYDAGTAADGRPYVAMEYVAGSSLTRFCDEQRLPVRERLELFLQVCAAIQHAHQKGVIHRDIKPSNLLVSIIDGRAVVKVIDFGIAKALQPGPEEPLLTQIGATLGTPEYMSPEQASADAGDVDTRSDVYALGVVLYELLVGARPFEARDMPRATPLAFLETVREKDPPKLTTRLLGLHGEPADVATRRGTDLKRLVRQLGGELEWITLRALEKQPAQRYASAAELAADIERHLKGEPVLAGPPSTIYRLRKLVRRHRVGAAALTVVAVAITAGAVASTLSLMRAVRAEHLAREQLRESFLNQARTLTNSNELDRRARALAALKEAAGILPGLDLRNAAIAALATPGFHVLRRWNPPTGGSLAVWPDTRLSLYARGNPDGTVSLHSIEDDAELARLPPVGSVAGYGIFSPDGSWLAVYYLNEELRVWNLSARTERLVVKGVRSGAFTPDSSQIIASCAEGHVHLHHLASGREVLQKWSGPSASVWAAVHPTEPLFLIPSYGRREIEIRRTDSGALDRRLEAPEMGGAAQWSADGKSLITAHLDFSIRVWDWPSMGAPRLLLRFHRAEPRAIATDPSGRWLATGGWDNQIAFFDLRDGRLLLSQPGRFVHAAADRSAFLLVNGTEWNLVEFEPAFALETIAMHENDKSPRDVAFSPSGRWLATAGDDGIRILDLRSRAVHRLMDDEAALRVAFSADSKQLHAVTVNHLRAWRMESDPVTGRLRAERLVLPGDGDHPSQARTTAGITANGERWLSVGRNAQTHRPSWILGRFDSADFESVEGFTPGGNAPEVSPDGRWLAWGNWHGRNAAVTRLGENGRPVELPAGDSAAVAFSPDSRLLAVGGPDDIRFYEVGTWRPVHTISRRPIGSLPQLAFTHDSHLCAVMLPPDRVMLIDTVTGQDLVTLPAGQHILARLAFSPDDRFLAVASTDHQVLLWDLGSLRRQLRDMDLDWELASERRR